MPLGISVIICCYNSSKRISPTLEHLYAQKNIALSSWEIILINNGSTDDTIEVANSVWNKFDQNKPLLRIVEELKPGLSAARKKGIEESNFDYVLFCDDDNWLNSDYLSLALTTMQRYPEIGALGGRGIPIFEAAEPPYFWTNQYHTLAVGRQSNKNGDITNERGVLYGAGMVINKSAYKFLISQFQFNFLVSDRIGDTLVSSGDHELCLALKRIGYRIFYNEKMNFKHYIPSNRTTITYYKKLFFGFGASYAILQPYRVNVNSINFKDDYRYIVLQCIKKLLFANLKLLFSGYYFKNEKHRYIDILHYLYANLGQLNTIMRLKNTYKTTLKTQLLFADKILV